MFYLSENFMFVKMWINKYGYMCIYAHICLISRMIISWKNVLLT